MTQQLLSIIGLGSVIVPLAFLLGAIYVAFRRDTAHYSTLVSVLWLGTGFVTALIAIGLSATWGSTLAGETLGFFVPFLMPAFALLPFGALLLLVLLFRDDNKPLIYQVGAALVINLTAFLLFFSQL